MGEWTDWADAWPDWKDAGRSVEVEYDDGSVVTGKLDIEDVDSDGEGSEWPVWVVITGDGATGDGAKRSFADNKRWRFVAPPIGG